MEQMTEMQKLRLELARELNYDLNKAKAVNEFVMGDNTPVTTKRENTGYFQQDGVYLLLEANGKQHVVHADDACQCDYDDAIAVGVKWGDKHTFIALEDCNNGEETPLCTGECGSEAFFIKKRIDAIRDYCGAANTDDMRGYIHSNIELTPGQYIPALGEWLLLVQYKEQVNEALEQAGGKPIQDTWYWSSTEHNSNSSWYVNFGDGIVHHSNKTYGHAVRPAVAYSEL